MVGSQSAAKSSAAPADPRPGRRRLFGKPVGLALIIIQKSVAAVFFALLAAGLIVLYFHGGEQPIYRLLFGELRGDPRDKLANFAISHLPDLSNRTLLRLGLGSTLYFLLEAVEAIGLMVGQYWVEIFIVIETGLFLPFEIYEMTHHLTAGKAATFAVNLLILWYLVRRYLEKRRKGFDAA